MMPFGELLRTTVPDARVMVPTHPGFAGTSPQAGLDSIAALARHYDALLDQEHLHDVTVIGNSIGGWAAAEMAALPGPRVARLVLVNAVGLDVPEQPLSDVSGLTPPHLAALSFHDPARIPQDPDRPGPDLVALRMYTGMRMTDPTLRDRLAGITVPTHVVWGRPMASHRPATAAPTPMPSRAPGSRCCRTPVTCRNWKPRNDSSPPYWSGSHAGRLPRRLPPGRGPRLARQRRQPLSVRRSLAALACCALATAAYAHSGHRDWFGVTAPLHLDPAGTRLDR